MKKDKLNLNDLKVTSFVTAKIKGGAFTDLIRTASGVCVCRTEDCEFKTSSGICVCDSEDCETQVACDLTNDCPIIKL